MKCELCGETIELAEAFDHLRVMHPEQCEEPLRWPDGEIVVIDATDTFGASE